MKLTIPFLVIRSVPHSKQLKYGSLHILLKLHFFLAVGDLKPRVKMILNSLDVVPLLSTTIVSVETTSNVDPSLGFVVVGFGSFGGFKGTGALKVAISLLIDS